ncbi:AAA domain-containing protein [Murinocardiopsis flavida]|uniref:AAA domain-containing protein n=1 Tax=Murinocardiopsis flavida TaxID=645275 RepID=A0A2P8D3H4_9ACTN|nr:AAA family ATPase [Murinocardiopsis flavida]PSK91729.1 AAA domain-containing protein [Murinocardiopsis flavida]
MLVILSGLPATGKTTIGRLAAADIGAVHVRVDTIEQAIVRSGLAEHPLGPAGYTVGHAVAGDILAQGLDVIAESVNPLPVTRSAWRGVAWWAGSAFVEAEVVCSDPVEHRRRVDTRGSDVPGLVKPRWEEVRDREYAPWTDARLVLDTALHGPADCAAMLRGAVEQERARGREPGAGSSAADR